MPVPASDAAGTAERTRLDQCLGRRNSGLGARVVLHRHAGSWSAHAQLPTLVIRSRERRWSRFGHTPTVPAVNRQRTVVLLCRFLQLDDGETAAPGQVADAQAEALAATPPDGSLRSGTWRTPGPSPARLEARRSLLIGRWTSTPGRHEISS